MALYKERIMENACILFQKIEQYTINNMQYINSRWIKSLKDFNVLFWETEEKIVICEKQATWKI